MKLNQLLSINGQYKFPKTANILRISVFLSIVTLFSTLANTNVYSQTEISINVENTEIINILDLIESSTDLRFFYDNDIYDFNEKKTLSFEKIKISKAINLIFDGKLDFSLTDNVVILKKSIEIAEKNIVIDIENIDEEDLQQIFISGTITDNDGNPLPGATVVELNTDNGTTADFDGKFSLAVSNENATIEVSFIGFETQQISASGDNIEIQLVASISGLDDVVVVGYGTQSQRDITSSISKISVDNMAIKSASNMQSIMYGKAAGVQVTSISGEPGAGVEIRIRGLGTTGNNMPLYVIDGVPIVTDAVPVGTFALNPLSGLSASDIQSIEILKDASSAAIYGARASNGVVMITTKRGQGLSETKFSYETSLGLQQLRKNYDVLNVQQYVAMQSDLGNDYSQFSGIQTIDGQAIAVNDNAPIVNHSMNISGGTENMNFSIMGNYFDQTAYTNRVGSFKRYSLRANSDIKVGKRLKFGESIQLSRSSRIEASDGSFLMYKTAQNAPFVPYLDSNGPGGYAVLNNASSGGAGFINWFAFNDTRYQVTEKDVYKVFGNVYGELEILKGLKFRTSIGVEFMDYGGKEKRGELDISSLEGFVNPTNINYGDFNSLTTNFNNILTYDLDLGKHSLKILAGHEETNYEFNSIAWGGINLTNPDIELALASQSKNLYDDLDHWALRGFLGRVNYSFNDKYYLTANLRQDSSSRFSKDTRTQLFPSVSAAWRISDESFMDGVDFINDLKIRASYGTVGNQNTGNNFAYIPSLGLSTHYTIGAGQTAVRAPVPWFFSNPNLKWETSEQIDIGIDASLFDGAVGATVDYYKKTTSDLLVSVPIPMTSGFLPDALINAGVVENSGIELSLSYFKSINDDFDINISANLTTVNNEVTSLADAEIITGISGLQSHRTVAGYSIGHFFGHQFDGIFQSQAEIDAHATQAGAQPGDVRFKDIAGPSGNTPDGVIDQFDRTYLGSPIPDMYYGLTISSRYKNFDITLTGQGVSGVQIFNNAKLGLENYAPGPGDNLSTSVLNRWTGPGSSDLMPRAVSNGGANANYRFSDMFIEEGSFLRLRDLQIGYNFSDIAQLTDSFIKTARLYFSGQNLLLITDYSGLDPEVTRGFSYDKGEKPLSTGQDDGRSPQPRIVQLGLQISF